MAKMTADEITRAEYLWRKVEEQCAQNLAQGAPLEEVERDRTRMWEKMYMQFGDLERFGRQMLPRMPEPNILLKQEMEKCNYAQRQQAHQQEAMRKARVEHMQSAAMACSITDGCNLWIARWGDGWVRVMDVQQASNEAEAFRWDTLCERLKRTNKIETDGEYVRVVI